MGLLGALSDKQFWRDVGSNTADLGQSASNAVASNVTAPVDLIALMMRGAGANIPEAPMGGSRWANNAGFTRPVADSPANIAGEALGSIAPILMMQKGPQVIAGLLRTRP